MNKVGLYRALTRLELVMSSLHLYLKCTHTYRGHRGIFAVLLYTAKQQFHKSGV